jgi:hypothetical protein
MARGRLAWALSLPLVVAGWITAHCVAHRAVPSEENMALHGYLAYVEIFALAGATLVLLGLAGAACEAVRGGPRRTPPVWLFAVLPPLGFGVQEHVEHLVATWTLPNLALDPTFLVGLLLQLPFALGAYFVARALVALGAAIGRALLGGTAPRLAPPPFCPAPAPAVALARISALALGYGERGPPAGALA